MKIILVRHPQTTWNEKGLFQGSKEGKVSRIGKLETKTFVSSTKNIQIDVIYCAQNKRCNYLARRLLELHPTTKIRKDFRLNERSFGFLEGTPEKKAAINNNFDPENYIEKYRWTPKGGESLKKVFPRIESFLSDVITVGKDGDIIFVITSGGVARLIMYALGLKNLKEAMLFKAKNLEMVEISYQSDYPTSGVG